MKEVSKAYKCDYCGRLTTTKGGMLRHEICCPKNPSNISLCKDCKYLQKKTYEDYNEYHAKYKITDFYCTKRDVHLYHPKLLRMYQDIQAEVLEVADTKMPTINEGCVDFKYNSIFDDDPDYNQKDVDEFLKIK